MDDRYECDHKTDDIMNMGRNFNMIVLRQKSSGGWCLAHPHIAKAAAILLEKNIGVETHEQRQELDDFRINGYKSTNFTVKGEGMEYFGQHNNNVRYNEMFVKNHKSGKLHQLLLLRPLDDEDTIPVETKKGTEYLPLRWLAPWEEVDRYASDAPKFQKRNKTILDPAPPTAPPSNRYLPHEPPPLAEADERREKGHSSRPWSSLYRPWSSDG